MCTICNEAPALPGKDMCLFCLKNLMSRLCPLWMQRMRMIAKMLLNWMK